MRLKKGAVCIVLEGRPETPAVHFFPKDQIVVYEGGDAFTGITIHNLETDHLCRQYGIDFDKIEVIGYL